MGLYAQFEAYDAGWNELATSVCSADTCSEEQSLPILGAGSAEYLWLCGDAIETAALELGVEDFPIRRIDIDIPRPMETAVDITCASDECDVAVVFSELPQWAIVYRAAPDGEIVWTSEDGDVRVDERGLAWHVPVAAHAPGSTIGVQVIGRERIAVTNGVNVIVSSESHWLGTIE